MTDFGFELLGEDGGARRGRVTTAHGTIETPFFMPVGTAASVKGMTPDAVAGLGAEIVLANTYHLMLRPGAERVAALGGLRKFMNWPGPILTDSGGFQVMSLSDLREITEAGVTFKSHLDGSRHELTPERAVEIQRLLDADISMVLDECPPAGVAKADIETSMELSLRWAERCNTAFGTRPDRALFGIAQGGVFPDLRARSVEGLIDIGFDGYAVGGLAVGEGQEAMFDVLDGTVPLLPVDKPRYLMGVGLPDDIVGAVARGIDMYDCVLPTRSGRTGRAFTRRGVVNIRNARHADDPRPLDEEGACPVSRDYSRAYLHHLFKADEMLGPILLTWHNLAYYLDLMADIRTAISEGRFADFAAESAARRAEGDIAAQ